jgi:hypothetical protein
MNQQRDILLKQIAETQQLNLTHVNQHLANSADLLIDDISQLFVTFCFVLEFNKDLRLIVTDEFLTTDQLKLFKKLINLPIGSRYEITDDAELKDAYSTFFEIDFTEVCTFFTNIFKILTILSLINTLY